MLLTADQNETRAGSLGPTAREKWNKAWRKRAASRYCHTHTHTFRTEYREERGRGRSLLREKRRGRSLKREEMGWGRSRQRKGRREGSWLYDVKSSLLARLSGLGRTAVQSSSQRGIAEKCVDKG